MNLNDWKYLKDDSLNYVLNYIKRKKNVFTLFSSNDIVMTLDKLNDLDEYICRKIESSNCLRFRDFESKCIRYIKSGNKTGNNFMVSFFIHLYEDAVYYFPRQHRKLSTYKNLFDIPTDADIDYSKKYFNYPCSSIMIYRGVKFYVFLDQDYAAIIDENNKEVIFPLDWDWWFNIDSYLFHRMY